MKSSFLRAGYALLCAVILSACGGDNGSLLVYGTISSLTKSGLVLINASTGEKLTIEASTTSFSFTKLAAVDEKFDVQVLTQPSGAKCTVTNGTGTANSYTLYYTPITVSCEANPYSLGGTVKGLSGSGLVLANGSDTVAVAAPATAGADVSFTFPTTVGDGYYYGATVLTQPTGQTCAVSSTLNPGTMPSGDQLGLVVNCSTN